MPTAATATTTTTTPTTTESNTTNNNEPPKEKFLAKMKRKTTNAGHATKLQAYKTKKQAQNQVLKRQVADRKKEFGVEYMNLLLRNASRKDQQECLEEAMADLKELQASIAENLQKMQEKEDVVRNERIKTAPDGSNPPSPPPPPPPPEQPADNRSKTGPSPSPSSQKKPSQPGRGGQPGGKGGRGPPPPAGRGQPAVSNNNNKGRATPPQGGRGSTSRTPSAKGGRGGGGPGRGAGGKPAPAARNGSTKGPAVMAVSTPEEYRHVDSSQWKLSEVKFSGSTSFTTCGHQEKITGQSIPEILKLFKANPGKYVALFYQSSMVDWPVDQHQCTLVHREGTQGFMAKDASPKGWMTMHQYHYERLPPYKDNELPKAHRDKYTDNMVFAGRKLHSKKNPPIMPGRGMGVGDTPLLKVIGDVDPSDISQGQVGDCWLLSAISAIAEFDGAIKNLYRKTPNLDAMPFSDKPNMYIITLWDLTTWKEVDVVVDERLCAAPDGRLLASKPSEDGELWVCYIEKAIAALAGGWDKLVGGQCTHAWALMTGCKEQYCIMKNPATGKYKCYGRYNSNEGRWARHANSPHDGEIGMWPMPWPKVGGGGDANLELTKDELFLRLVAWDEENYIVGAGTGGTSDKNSTDGLVDNHAYSVIESRDNVAGTGIGLLKVRNPWGSGEIENGEFDDDGPGWDKYPQIKKELKPVVADDGIFWVTKKEFFEMYTTIYLSASNMTEFLED